MNWIKVEDEKPYFDIPVLVYCRIWGRYLAHYERIDPEHTWGQWVDFKGEKGILPPTHWMPLPDPPIDPVDLTDLPF